MESATYQRVHLYCGVAYKDKELAKSLGARWDTAKKAWYFVANGNQIGKNETIHTFSFKPMAPKIIDFNPLSWNGSEALTEDYVSRAIYNTMMNRWNINKNIDWTPKNDVTTPTTYEVDNCLI